MCRGAAVGVSNVDEICEDKRKGELGGWSISCRDGVR
jgi:hypothetical protein